MAYKSADEILKPDSRFDNLCVPEGEGLRFMTIADHHQMIEEVALAGAAPAEVRDAYDRARNAKLYAFFDYDLFVVGEVQAFGAFELALKHRLNGHGVQSVLQRRTVEIPPARVVVVAPVPNVVVVHEALGVFRV